MTTHKNTPNYKTTPSQYKDIEYALLTSSFNDFALKFMTRKYKYQFLDVIIITITIIMLASFTSGFISPTSKDHIF